MGLAAALARNPSPKALMGGEAGTCRTGCRRLKGPRGPWLPARGTAPHTPFSLSQPGQQPAVIARPLAARKRGTAGHWGQSLTVSEPREKAGHGGSPSPLQAARPDPLLSEHGRHVCVWSARSSAVIGRVAFSQAQKEVRDHRPERPQARQRQHQWGGDGVCVCLAQAWADGILPFPREVRTRTVVRNPDFQLSQRENPYPASRQAVGSLLHLFRGWGWACPYLVQCLLQHALGGLPAALGHVAGCLPVEQQQGRGALVGHLLEDVVGVLELLTSLRGRMDITALSPCCPALPQPAPSWRALTAGGPGQAPWGHCPLPHRGP